MSCSLILPSGDWILNCDDSNESCLALLLSVCFQLSTCIQLYEVIILHRWMKSLTTSLWRWKWCYTEKLKILFWCDHLGETCITYKAIRLVLGFLVEIPKRGQFNESYTKLYFLCGVVYFTTWSLPFKLRRKGWKCDCAFETNEHRSYLTNHPSSPQVGHEAAIIRRHVALSCALSCP